MTNEKRLSVFVICSFFVCSFILRLVPLGRYVTPDEPAWVYRSIRFVDALAARSWSALPKTGHPGVTTMWLGAIGVTVRRLLNPAQSAVHLNWIRHLAWLAPENGEAFRRLAFFLPYGRVAVALATTLGLVVLYPLLVRLFDRRTPLITVGLLAFDPFLIGHSGLLHTDALLATFTLLALVVALLGLREPRRIVWWLLAGLFAGLAMLTKTPGLILLPFILLLAAVRCLQSAAWNLQSTVRACSLFSASLLIVLLAIHPGLWPHPLDTLRTLLAFAERHVETVQRPIFFFGQMTHDPGPAFYPVVLLFRVSPVVLLGLALGIVNLRRLSPARRFAFLTLLAFAVLFGVGMSLGAKKHDRYLLPAFPPLALAAALGMDTVADQYTRRSVARPDLPIIVLQVIIALVFAAYPLAYANPLLGGPWVAARVLPVGWGEGMGIAASRLNQLRGANHLTIAAANVPSFASLFVGHTIPLDGDAVPLSDYIVAATSDHQSTQLFDQVTTGPPGHLTTNIYANTAPFEQADYLTAQAAPNDLIVLDANTPLLRRYEGPGTLLSTASLPDEAAVAELLARQAPERGTIWLVASAAASPITADDLRRQVEALATPVSTATVASGVITRFEARHSKLESSTSSYRTVFDGQLALVASALPKTVAWPDALPVVLRWRARRAPLPDYRAILALRDDEGHTWSKAEMPVFNSVFFPTSAWEAGEWSDAPHELRLPPSIPPGRYAVEVSAYDSATGARLGATGPDGGFRGTRLPVGEVTVAPPAAPPDVTALDIPQPEEISAGPLKLLGYKRPTAQVLSGDRLSFGLFWQADAAPEVDYGVGLGLVGSDGHPALRVVAPLSPYPTSRWRAEDRYQSRHTLRVRPDIHPGRYQLTLNVLGSKDRPLWQKDQVLAAVEVLPRERTFTLPEGISHPLDLTFGRRIHLRGYDLKQTQAAPGGALPLTLYWQAEGPTERDHTLFVHLLSPDGVSRGQVDRTPGGGAAPTSTWAADQVIVEEIALPVAPDAPDGIYRVAVGFYDPAYGDRLPVTDSSGQRVHGDQAVLPVEITVSGDGQ